MQSRTASTSTSVKVNPATALSPHIQLRRAIILFEPGRVRIVFMTTELRGWETGRWPLAPTYRAHPRLYRSGSSDRDRASLLLREELPVVARGLSSHFDPK